MSRGGPSAFNGMGAHDLNDGNEDLVALLNVLAPLLGATLAAGAAALAIVRHTQRFASAGSPDAATARLPTEGEALTLAESDWLRPPSPIAAAGPIGRSRSKC